MYAPFKVRHRHESASTRRAGLSIWLLATLGVSLLCPAASGQPLAAGPANSVPTPESIETLRQQATANTELDDDTKQKIEAACALALQSLQRIAEVTTQAEQFRKDGGDVEQRMTELRRKLAIEPGVGREQYSRLTRTELEQEVARAEVNLAEKKHALAKAEAEPTARANRRKEVRSLLASGGQRVAEIQQQLETAAPADEPPLLTQARQAELRARRAMIEAEVPALQNELLKYDAEDAADYLRIVRDLRMRDVEIATKSQESLQKVLSERRAADAADIVARANREMDAAPTALKKSSEQNLAIAEATHALTQSINETQTKLDEQEAVLERLQKQFNVTRDRVKEIGLTGSIGSLLRRQRVDLPNQRQLRKRVQDRKSLIEDRQYELFEFNESRSESIEDIADEMTDDAILEDADLEPRERQELAAAAQSIAEQRHGYLDGVIKGYNDYLDTLYQLDITEQLLALESMRYATYIDERVLWIRSNRPIFTGRSGDLFERGDRRAHWVDSSDTWALQPANWQEVGQQMLGDLRRHFLVYVLSIIVVFLLVWQKPRFRRELTAISERVTRGTCTDFMPTVRAMFLTAMHTLAWPGLVLFLAWRMSISSNGSQFARALAEALFVLSWAYFPLELLRQVCRPNGLAISHFGWSSSCVRVFRSNLRWSGLLGLPVVFVTALLYASDPEHGIDTIERLCFVLGLVILAVCLARVLHPSTGIFREHLMTHPEGWFARLKLFWYWTAVLTPLAIGGMTLLGYYYSARQVTWRFYATFVFLALTQLLRAVLERLLLVRRRAISIQQARQRRAESAGEESAMTQLAPDQLVPTEEIQVDVATNTQQSKRLIRTGVWATALVGSWLTWVDVLPALRILDDWPLWTTTVAVAPEVGELNTAPLADGESLTATAPGPGTEVRPVTVAHLGLAILIGIVTVICARNIPGLMEMSVLRRLPLDNSIRYAITSVTSYAIVLLGIVLSFNSLLIGWSKVQWLATALTFGLAFGVQEIFANFVAGLILLFERPIRVGDVVTVDEVTGVISRIRIRATTITNWDRKEYVIPNKEFITGRMLNWTLSDKTNRVVINVGVAYGSDVDRAKELLLRTCRDNPLVLDDPPTLVTFEGFGDSTLNLVVRAFLPDLDNRLRAIDQLHTAIDKCFRAEGIEIAFPQRDLHVRSVDGAVWASASDQESRGAA